MPGETGGMELWAIVPELILGTFILLLLPLGAFLPAAHKAKATWIALGGLAAAAFASVPMLAWPAQAVFLDTYSIDRFAVFFKLFAIAATALTLLMTQEHFRGKAQEGAVPAVLLLTCAGIVLLAASQDLVLIALAIQLVTVGSYVLVGMSKDDRRASEGALKLFLFSAAAGAVMLYGMSLLYGLTGSLRLPELARLVPKAPLVTVGAALGLTLVGYGFKITLVPFHVWAPDAYQGASTPIAGFISVAPKAAGLAVLIRTLLVAFPGSVLAWPEVIAALAALTMTVGNVFALRQTGVKRLLAYSSIAQAGYLLVGVAAAARDPLALPGVLLYLTVYLFMNLGAFFSVEALERHTGSDDLTAFAGLGRRSPYAAGVLALCLLSLAGLPPLGGFVAKTALFGAALGAGWTWLAVVMGANVALSLYFYARLLEPLYLRGASGDRFESEPGAMRVALLVLAIGSLATGIAPQPWVRLASHAAELLAASVPLH